MTPVEQAERERLVDATRDCIIALSDDLCALAVEERPISVHGALKDLTSALIAALDAAHKEEG